MYAFGLLADAVMDKIDQGERAHMPGYGTETALPLLGADRQLVQAPAETNAAFITRLKGFLQTWQHAGNATSLLQQVRNYLTPYLPLMRLVSDSGVWDYYDLDQVADVPPTHAQIISWDWGADWTAIVGLPQWWRFWCLFFPGLSIAGGSVTGATNASPIHITTASAHGLSTDDEVCITGVAGNLSANGYWVVTVVDTTHFELNSSSGSGAYTSGGTAYLVPADAVEDSNGSVLGPAPFVWGQPGVTWGGNPNVSWGLNVPPSFFQPLRQLADTWKAAHAWLRYFVISFDTNWGTPWAGSQPAGGAGGPGTWGTCETNVDGVMVPSRNPNVRCVAGVA
jgi:hypothetical protein